MVITDVNNENPKEHWQYINFQPNEIAVDFGCGRWEGVEERDSSWMTTPEYLLSLGAEYVYGFDKDEKEINWFNEKFMYVQQMKFIQKDLSLSDAMLNIISDLEPDIVKCDIEKYEINLLYIPTLIFRTVRLYAIETHRNWIYNVFMSEFPNRGYEIKAVINLIHAKPMKVIFAERI
jgi:hypothetical protein